MAHFAPRSDDYGDEAMPLDRLIHRNRHTRCIRYAEADGQWKQGPSVRRVCKDMTGRWREEHSYLIEERKGTTCAFCGRIRPGGDMRERIV